jgi:hypothetical protein
VTPWAREDRFEKALIVHAVRTAVLADLVGVYRMSHCPRQPARLWRITAQSASSRIAFLYVFDPSS